MSDHERTLQVIGAFYDAAMDESLWSAALNGLMELTKSQASSFWVLDSSESAHLSSFIYLNFDPEGVQEYLDGMAQFDPTVRYLVAHPQEPVVHDGLLPNTRDERSRLYLDWHERKIETRFRIVGQARLAGDFQAGVALHRTRGAGRYELPEIERFAELQRHLERALAIGVRLASLRAMQQFSVDWFDRSNSAVVLLDEHRRVLYANCTAVELSARDDGVRLSTAGIALAQRKDDGRLQSLIARAITATTPLGASTGGFMPASRPSERRPYNVMVTPVARTPLPLSLFRPAVLIVITDPEERPLLPTERLQNAFGFTKAEARLASLLAAGDDLRAAADKLRITYGTARARLAQIFQKTDTRRQGELIRLLLTTMMAG